MNLFTETRREPALDYFGEPYTKFITERKPLSYEQLWDQFKASMKIADDYKRKHGLFGTVASESWQNQEILRDQIQKQHI